MWSLRHEDFPAVRARRADLRRLLESCVPSHLAWHELVFGELVANAVRHGHEPMWASVFVDDDTVRIEVVSSGDCFDLKARLADEPTDTGGRGLHIVRRLAETLAVHYGKNQCRVVATLPL